MATPAKKKSTTSKRVTPKKLQAPESVTLDLDALSWDDLEEIEEHTGWGMDVLFSEKSGVTIKGIKALLWVELKKNRPDVTIAEVGKLKFNKTNLVSAEKPGPTNAG